MLSEGAEARAFDVPAVVDGEIERLSLDTYLGEQIVVLAFYPGDFNPGCGDQSDLAELDLFAMQPDVAVIAVAPDTVYSHRQFAAEYDLDVTLCADTTGAVATSYDVRTEDEYGQMVPERAAFVIDLDGTVQYAWSTTDVEARFDGEAIQRAVADIGGDRAAVSRYRVGHAHYVEGRRGFTSAMGAMEDTDWIVARSDFQRACEEFKTADDHFATATRYVESERIAECFERAGTKATALWQAADWLAEAADAFSSGHGEEGQAYRHDAEAPLETARDIPEPVEPVDIEVDDGIVSIPDGAHEEREDSVMEAIRDRIDPTDPAGGIGLEDGEVPTATDQEHSETEGPDTEAARRLREYAGVGIDIDDPSGAGDEQVADALEATEDDTDRASSRTAGTPPSGPAGQTGTASSGSSAQSPSTPPSASDNDTASPADGDPAKADDNAHSSTPDVTEEEIEAIAEELAAEGPESDSESETQLEEPTDDGTSGGRDSAS